MHPFIYFVEYIVLWYTYLDPLWAVLHVDPVVDIVPHGLDTQVIPALYRVRQTSKGLDEEVLWHLSLPRQHQDPGVHPQTIVWIWWRLLHLLIESKLKIRKLDEHVACGSLKQLCIVQEIPIFIFFYLYNTENFYFQYY